MADTNLKLCLSRFPEPGWNREMDFQTISESELLTAIGELLAEHGRFPPRWSSSGGHRGLLVEGADDRYIGHWLDVEGAEGESQVLSIASEDLGDVEAAAQVIFRTYFSHSRQPKE